MCSTCSSCALPRPGIFSAILASFCYSLCSASAKLLNRHFSPFQAVYARGCITALFATIILLKDVALPLPQRPVRVFALWAIARGILGAVTLATFYKSLTILPLSEGAALLAMSPISATVMSRVLLGERISWVRMIALTFFVVGALFVTNPLRGGMESSLELWIARFFALGASVTDGTSVVCARRLSVENCHWMTQGFWYGLACMSLSPIASYFEPYVQVSSNIPYSFLFLAIGGSAVLAECFFGFATTREQGAIVGVLGNLGLMFSLVWQQTIFATNIQWYQAVGVIFIVTASVSCVLEKKYYEWQAASTVSPGQSTVVTPTSQCPGELVAVPMDEFAAEQRPPMPMMLLGGDMATTVWVNNNNNTVASAPSPTALQVPRPVSPSTAENEERNPLQTVAPPRSR